MSKFFYNWATTSICAKKPFIVIECKIITTHKKVNKRPYWLVKNTPHSILWFEREQLIHLTDNCEWKAQNLRRKWSSNEFAKRATCEFFSALFLLLVGSGPKWSMPIEKLGSSSLVSSIFQREGEQHRSLTGRKLWSQAKKCSRDLIYSRACVNKDFVHSGSIGLI